MDDLTIKEIGIKLTHAGRLKTKILCVYGSNIVPDGAIHIKKLNRCLARAIFSLSTSNDVKSIYFGTDALNGCCPGGTAWFGYASFMPMLKFFLSTGSESFRNGAAEYLLANPDLAEKQLASVGKITPLGNYTIIRQCNDVNDDNFVVNAFIGFGIPEQVRNLCALACFRPDKELTVQIPWGPSCASFVTYPAGLAENGPKNGIIVGPTDPTGNHWFPQNCLSIGIPFEIAKRMANDLDNSFIKKRPNVAYPTKRASYEILE